MIEAVNSVIANSAITRGPAEQQSPARSFAANPERVQEVPRAPYVSPYIFVDVTFDEAVLQIRDSETGDVVRQFPSESQLEAYRRAQQASDSQSQPQNQTNNVQTSSSQSAAQPETSNVDVQASQPAPASNPQPSAPAPQTTSVDTQA